MATLCIDTATEAGILALERNRRLLGHRRWKSSSRHGENLFVHLDALLLEAGVERLGIDAIGVVIGPGRFTSVRVGLSTAKGLSFGLKVPIVGVGSLRVLARSASAADGVVRVALMNAYRGDLFGAAYRMGSEAGTLVEPLFGSPDEVLSTIARVVGERPVVACGEGAVTHADAVQRILGIPSHATLDVEATPAALVAEVLNAYDSRGPDDLDSLEPDYLRPSDAKLPATPPTGAA